MNPMQGEDESQRPDSRTRMRVDAVLFSRCYWGTMGLNETGTQALQATLGSFQSQWVAYIAAYEYPVKTVQDGRIKDASFR